MSRLISVSAAAVVAMAVSSMSLAQDLAPATSPATAPAVVVVTADQTSPRGALKVLTKAMDEGDIATAEKVMISDSETETTWAGAMLKLSTASVTTRRTSIQAFGEEGAKAIIGDAAAAATYAMTAIDRSTEEVDGDKATVRSNDGVEAPIELRKINGEWRVPVKVFVSDAPAEKLNETADKMSRQAAAIEAFCTEMAAGKFKTPEDAAQALQLAQVKAVFGEPPTSGPATQPTMPG